MTATGCRASSLLAHDCDDSGVPLVTQGTISIGRCPTPPCVALTYWAPTSAPRRRSGNEPTGASSVLISPMTTAFEGAEDDCGADEDFEPPVHPVARIGATSTAAARV